MLSSRLSYNYSFLFMPTLLLLETATEICSVAIAQNGKVLHVIDAPKDYAHSESLTLLIEACSEKANTPLSDLDGIAISSGPGSYTALRVGSSVAKGICYAFDLPLMAIDTLTALARATAQKVHLSDALYAPMIDARRMEVYTALYDATGKIVEDRQAKIIDTNSFANYFEQGKRIVFSGNGAAKCQTVLTHPLAQFESLVCDAQHLVPLAELAYQQQTFEDVAYFSPIYGKAPNITVPKKKLL